MYNRTETVHNNKNVPIKEYRKRKLKMLSRDFRITLTAEELAHAETLTTETQLDQFALGIIDKRLDK